MVYGNIQCDGRKESKEDLCASCERGKQKKKVTVLFPSDEIRASHQTHTHIYIIVLYITIYNIIYNSEIEEGNPLSRWFMVDAGVMGVTVAADRRPAYLYPCRSPTAATRPLTIANIFHCHFFRALLFLVLLLLILFL